MNRQNFALPNIGPPNETGGIHGPARLNSLTALTVIAALREINNYAPPAYANEGWRLLNQYQSTSNVKHLSAFCRHVGGICIRIGANLQMR
jgi:hypothetical protein